MATAITPQFSVLDLMPVSDGQPLSTTVQQTIALAKHVEDRGYARFWLAEHHGMPAIASSAPSIMIGQVASATTRLRVGSGGVMLPNHPPLVVAEQFGTLDALFPGRIDLGIGRAPGTDPMTAHALRRNGLSAEDFPEQLTQLRSFLSGEFPQGHPYESIVAIPGRGATPQLWLLGSGGYSATAAGMLGLPFAFARHISPTHTEEGLATYRAAFRPSATLAEPYAIVTTTVLAAPTDEEAQYLAGPQRLMMARLRQNRPISLPSAERAAEIGLTDQERQLISGTVAGSIVGSPQTVNAKLDELVAFTSAQEIMVSTITFDHASRLRSYDIVADYFH